MTDAALCTPWVIPCCNQTVYLCAKGHTPPVTIQWLGVRCSECGKSYTYEADIIDWQHWGPCADPYPGLPRVNFWAYGWLTLKRYGGPLDG